VPVVFDPRVANTLVGHLASAINGSSIARKTSFLKERMGERLFRPGIRIVDCDHGKFMNHNERPNTDFTVFDRGYALVDIQKGEEITCNYAEFDPSFVMQPGRNFCAA